MAIYKNDKNGNWYAHGSVNKERYHNKLEGAKNKSEALEMDNAIRREISLRQKGLLAPEKKRYMLKDGIVLWHNHCKFNVDYKHDISMINVIEDYFGVNTYLDEITLNKATRFIWYVLKEMPNARTKQKGHKPATANRYMAKLQKIMSLSLKEKYIEDNPLIAFEKLDENNIRDRVLSPEEEVRLFQNLPEYQKAIVLIELRTSLRKAKILQLKWEDIDFENKIIKIVKIRKGKPVPDSLPLTKEAEECLLNLPRLSEYVFTNTKTGTAFTNIYKGFTNALKNANIENFTFHDLRRTVGTRMLTSGSDIRTVQQQLGHSRVTTTERYTHPDMQERRQAVEKLDSYGKDNNDK